MSKYYRRDGTPYTGSLAMLEWVEDSERNKIVKQEKLKNGFLVSTVWLGLDHNFEPGGKPLIFETMVFDHRKSKSFLDLDCLRYSTEEEAIKGHKKLCKKWGAR